MATATELAVQIPQMQQVIRAGQNMRRIGRVGQRPEPFEPLPNANGWNNTDVTLTLTATDDLSGVQRTEFTLDDSSWRLYRGPISIVSEGTQLVRFRSVDRAGNIEMPQTVTVRIDKAPPEASVQLDPATRDVIVVVRDAGSGVAADPQATRAGDLRTYVVVDRAGNSVTLVVRVRKGKEGQLLAQVVRLQYGTAAPVTPTLNQLRIEWELQPNGHMAELSQTLSLERGAERQVVHARYDADRNKTEIEVESAKSERTLTRSGVVLLRLTTDHGTLRSIF